MCRVRFVEVLVNSCFVSCRASPLSKTDCHTEAQNVEVLTLYSIASLVTGTYV